MGGEQTFVSGDRVRHVRSGVPGTIVEQLSACWVDWRPDGFDGPQNGAIRTDPSNLTAEPAAEQPTDLRNLVGEEVARVTAHPHGICIRFGSGTAIVIPRGVTFDGVGNPVIEP
jgi:hypothetical protein